MIIVLEQEYYARVINEKDIYGNPVYELYRCKRKMPYVSNYKAVCSGQVIEIYKYEKGIGYNYSPDSSPGGKRALKGDKREDNINQSKKQLRRLINTNITPDSKFITLTFKENLSDVKTAKNHFKKFVMRWNYQRKKMQQEPLKYCYVVEFQKRGAVHFHCVFFNVEYIKNKDLNSLWGHGFIKINKIDNVDNVGSYVVKYMSKDLVDERLNSHDLYGRSRGNLEEPIEITKPLEVCRLLKVYEKNIVYSDKFNNEYRGNIEYCQINLKRKINQMRSIKGERTFVIQDLATVD